MKVPSGLSGCKGALIELDPLPAIRLDLEESRKSLSNRPSGV
jgi:hypothetical protein